jgi:DHA1 family bicyclomycin/chloramphenicol resistance-like MFS transporter
VRHGAVQLGERLRVQPGQRLGEDRPAPGRVLGQAAPGRGGEGEADHPPVASALCALAPSPGALVGLRLVQGLAGAVGVVVSRAVIRDLYSGVAAAKYFSRLTIVFGLAPVAAPLLGALVLRVTSWRGVFAVLAAIGVLMLVGVTRLLPETLPEERRSAGGLRNTARAARTLAADRQYVGFALAQALAFGGMFAYIAGASFVVQDAFGASAQTYALMFGGNALGLVLLSQVNARLLDRFRASTLLGAALVANLAATAGLVLVAGLHSLAALGVLLFLAVATLGMVMPNGTSLALDGHPERAGTAAALLGAAQFATGALVAPLVGLAGEDSARPMAVVMLSCSVLAIGAFAIGAPARARRASPAPAPVRR